MEMNNQGFGVIVFLICTTLIGFAAVMFIPFPLLLIIFIIGGAVWGWNRQGAIMNAEAKQEEDEYQHYLQLKEENERLKQQLQKEDHTDKEK
jgi:membrane protein insertase Oxa1/YidC/SpoIIIJ